MKTGLNWSYANTLLLIQHEKTNDNEHNDGDDSKNISDIMHNESVAVVITRIGMNEQENILHTSYWGACHTSMTSSEV